MQAGDGLRTGIAARISRCWREVAGAKGLEPSASAVTGQRSNQLSYAPAGGAKDLIVTLGQVKNDGLVSGTRFRLPSRSLQMQRPAFARFAPKV